MGFQDFMQYSYANTFKECIKHMFE